MKVFSSIVMALALSATPACGDDHAHGDESPGADACEHLEVGPIVALTASDEPGTAPVAAESHIRYDLTLADMGGVPGGFVALPITEAGEYLVFLNAGTTLSLVDPAGEVLVPELEGTSSPDCAEVGAWAQFDLTIGTYTLELKGPSGASTISLVRIPAGSDGAHD